MAPSVKYHAKQTVLMYAATAGVGPTIDLSGSSRTIEVDEAGNEIDVSTRDDFLADATAYLTNPAARSINFQGLDTTPHSSRTWSTIDVSDAGRVAVYPLGSTPTGLPYEIGNVICTGSKYSSPHDNAANWTVTWRINGPWADGTT